MRTEIEHAMQENRILRWEAIATELALRLTLKGDAAFVAAAYQQAQLPVPLLVAREASGEDL